MTKSTQQKRDLNKRVREEIMRAVHSPRRLARIKAFGALPKRFPGTVGFRYDPEWQNDILGDTKAPPGKAK